MKTNTRSFKFLLFLVLGVLSVLGMKSFAADPSFSIIPAELTGKLHCNYIFNMKINSAGIAYNTFQSTIRFDSGNVFLSHISINPVFNYLTHNEISGWFLYKTRWAMVPWESSTATLTNALEFWFKTIQNITGTELLLTDKNWDPIVFDTESMSDGAVLQGYVSTKDILTGVNQWTYTFVPLPCVIDTNSPSIYQNIPTNYVPDNYVISFVLYDWIWAQSIIWTLPMGTNNTSHYRYSWNNTSILSNYVDAPNTVDNQEWVNSGTISITVACPMCSWWAWWSYTTPAIPSLSIEEWTGNSSYNMLTRQNKIRGYAISFPAPAPYEVEKQVNVNISVTDNPNENGNTHTGTPSFSFNAPQNPTIIMNAPSPTINVSTMVSPLTFTFSDSWAGIDTWTMRITIQWVNSGTKIYTWVTYTRADFTGIIITHWSPWLGNSWSYQVSIYPVVPFPSNTTIYITWSVYDLANNPSGIRSFSFTTTKSCADLWCADYFTVNIFTWFNAGTFWFTGTLIQITWTNINSPYPYLTGINNDILMCGLPYTWTILTGNIWIYDTTGVMINGTLYTWWELYITWIDGVDFTYDNGVIIIQ